MVRKYLEQISLDDINQIESDGSTALHAAAYYGHDSVVELLLEKGACSSTRNRYGFTPFDEAKTDHLKHMIRRRTNKTRFTSESLEWILSTNDADYQAHEYWKKLEMYGKDPQCGQLIAFVQDNYVNKELQNIEGISTITQFFEMAIKKKRSNLFIKSIYSRNWILFYSKRSSSTVAAHQSDC